MTPLQIMDSIERDGWKRIGLPLPYSKEYKLSDDPTWHELRASVEGTDDRERFEVWALTRFGLMVAGKPESVLNRDRHSGDYLDPLVWAAWEGWRAGRRQS